MRNINVDCWIFWLQNAYLCKYFEGKIDLFLKQKLKHETALFYIYIFQKLKHGLVEMELVKPNKTSLERFDFSVML